MPGDLEPAFVRERLLGSIVVAMSIWNDETTHGLAQGIGAVN
jgi:hypothetical protein